ncbi:MAG: 3-dehydroquinate synthase [Thiotrichales bacterium]|nr:3-dehydroquinate synthase [Thiotrichales bacterium]
MDQRLGPEATALYWQRFSVPYEFPVAFTRGLFRPENLLLVDALARREPDKRHRCLFYIDDGLAGGEHDPAAAIEAYADAHDDRIELVDAPTLIPGGERIKRELTWIEGIQDTIHRLGIDRHSYVVAVGGGAVLDAVGLAAATAHRGVRHVRAPTTVLAQADSGVGVKNAVNLNNVKNFVGTFAPPWAVLNDLDFLRGLPRRDRISGIAEAVKVGLIRDRAFFEWLETNAAALAGFEPTAEEHMIRRCAELHMHQIAHGGDPFELGSARPLDYGHWSAHKLEALTRNHVRHGEAVAIGLALDARYSVLAGLLPEGDEERVAGVLERLGLRLWHPALVRPDAAGALSLLVGLREFQEHLGGELTVTLLRELGVGVEVHAIDADLVRQSLEWLRARDEARGDGTGGDEAGDERDIGPWVATGAESRGEADETV